MQAHRGPSTQSRDQDECLRKTVPFIWFVGAQLRWEPRGPIPKPEAGATGSPDPSARAPRGQEGWPPPHRVHGLPAQPLPMGPIFQSREV